MRKIEIVDDLWIRFPGRLTVFDSGAEVGMASVLMAEGAPFFQRTLSVDAVETLRPLADKFNYRLTGRASLLEADGEDVIPVVGEERRVGKRDLNNGHVRVRRSDHRGRGALRGSCNQKGSLRRGDRAEKDRNRARGDDV